MLDEELVKLQPNQVSFYPKVFLGQFLKKNIRIIAARLNSCVAPYFNQTKGSKQFWLLDTNSGVSDQQSVGSNP